MVRSRNVNVRFSDDELKDLDFLCSYYNLSRSEVVRKLILDMVDRLDV